ncbi:MAG: hypothetical protein AB8G16_03145 [Gammaproteobacteria bacterium]
MKKIISALALVALLGGCSTTTNNANSAKAATTQTAQNTKAAEDAEAEKLRDDEILCARQMRTGSHRKTRVCRTVAERKRERQQAQEIMRNTQTGGTRVVD